MREYETTIRFHDGDEGPLTTRIPARSLQQALDDVKTHLKSNYDPGAVETVIIEDNGPHPDA
jgi:hypothetical protein